MSAAGEEEKEPMMGDKQSKNEDKDNDEDVIDPRDNDKKFYVCGVCSPVCATISIGVLIILEFGFLIYELVVISNNSFFDNSYGLIYLVLLVPLLISIGIFVVFFFEIRNPKKREWIPEALLGVSITNFAICVWVFLYIAAIYENRSVAVEKKLGLGPIKHEQQLSPTEAGNTEVGVGGVVETASLRERELRDKGY